MNQWNKSTTPIPQITRVTNSFDVRDKRYPLSYPSRERIILNFAFRLPPNGLRYLLAGGLR